MITQGERAARACHHHTPFLHGCPPDLQATIIYVSPRAEFTPPVIYSQSARAKLVFLIEARPDKVPDTIALAPGLPVSVAPFAEGGS